MAFVFGKSIKIAKNKNSNIPGPGQYDPSNQRGYSQYSAPFNTSSFKQSIFEGNSSTTGPGSYNPIYSKDINSKNQNKSLSNFNSKVQRFKTQFSSKQKQNSPRFHVSLVSDKQKIQKTQDQHQKLQYKQVMNRTKNKMNNIQQNNNKRKINSIVSNKDYVRIILSSPKNTQNMHSVFVDKHIVKRQSGPGSYQLTNNKQIIRRRPKSITDWSKNPKKRFKTQNNKNPGPGQYNVNNNVAKKGQFIQSSSSFASTVMRSHMDEIIYKTKIAFKARFIQQKKLKDKYPGPGQYDPSMITSKSFHCGQVNFGSINQNDLKQQQVIPGPGYYDFDKKKFLIKQQLKKQRQKIFGKKPKYQQKVQTLQSKNKQQLVKQFLRQIQSQKNKYYSLKERCSSKIGNFNYQQRFKEKHKQMNSSNPGPGQYISNNSHSLQNINKYNYGFNSTESRKFIQQKGNLNLPFYDVDKNDIGKKALKIQRNIQNLKMIDIQKAPFNCRQKRHSVIESPNKQRQKIQVNEFQKLNKQKSKRQILLKKQIFLQRYQKQNSVFRSTTKRNNILSNNNVGPGQYNHKQSLQKKSFNKQYNYKPPCKIRSNYLIKSASK